MAFQKGTKANFETLTRAFQDEHVCLLECQDRKTGEVVPVICAVGWDEDSQEYEMSPFAQMYEENPFERLAPPAAGGGFENGS